MAEAESTQVPTATAVDDGSIAYDARAPQGDLCPSCGCPVESGDRFCPACGTSRGDEPITATAVEPQQKHFRCNNCGSEVAADPDQRSYVCPFCDSTYVVEFAPEESNRQRPEFVIGFSVTREQAHEKFVQWLRHNSWIRPGDLARASIADKQKGVYLPFWSFSMLAESNWSTTIGEYWYRTETYTTTDSKGKRVTRTRRVQETEWWPLSGRHHQYYSGYLISASRGLPQNTAARIMPFNLPAMKRYAPYFLAGWLAEEYSVERDAALEMCLAEFRKREQANVAAFLPGNTYRGLEVKTNFSQTNSDLCLLPVYVLSYRYRDRLYRFLVNGQTGKFDGDKPLSWKRISAAIIAGVILALIIFVIIALLNR
jgi:DNA-directed RNA polymerase subunit RPC12/RpoP